MNKSIREIKRIARGNLTMRYKVPITAFLLSSFAAMVVDSPFSNMFQQNPNTTTYLIYLVATLLSGLILSLFTYGHINVQLKIARLGRPEIKDIFKVFKDQPDRYILGTLLLALNVVVAALPFFLFSVVSGYLFASSINMLTILNICLLIAMVITGIYVLFSLVYLPFLLIDRTDLKIMECYKKARELSVGNMRYITKMILSFIGWILISALSLGIGYLWVVPYFAATLTAMYLEAIGELDDIEKKKYSVGQTFSESV